MAKLIDTSGTVVFEGEIENGGSLPQEWTVNEAPGDDGDAVIVRFDLSADVQGWVDNVADDAILYGCYDHDGNLLWGFDGYGGATFAGTVVSQGSGVPVLKGSAADAVIVQGSGAIIKAAAVVEYQWSRDAAGVCTVTFNITLDAGTAGQAGQPVTIKFPSARAPSGAEVPSFGTIRCPTSGATDIMCLPEVGVIGGYVQLSMLNLDGSYVGVAGSLIGPGTIKGGFSYREDNAF